MTMSDIGGRMQPAAHPRGGVGLCPDLLGRVGWARAVHRPVFRLRHSPRSRAAPLALDGASRLVRGAARRCRGARRAAAVVQRQPRCMTSVRRLDRDCGRRWLVRRRPAGGAVADAGQRSALPPTDSHDARQTHRGADVLHRARSGDRALRRAWPSGGCRSARGARRTSRRPHRDRVADEAAAEQEQQSPPGSGPRSNSARDDRGRAVTTVASVASGAAGPALSWAPVPVTQRSPRPLIPIGAADDRAAARRRPVCRCARDPRSATNPRSATHASPDERRMRPSAMTWLRATRT